MLKRSGGPMGMKRCFRYAQIEKPFPGIPLEPLEPRQLDQLIRFAHFQIVDPMTQGRRAWHVSDVVNLVVFGGTALGQSVVI